MTPADWQRELDALVADGRMPRAVADRARSLVIALHESGYEAALTMEIPEVRGAGTDRGANPAMQFALAWKRRREDPKR